MMSVHKRKYVKSIFFNIYIYIKKSAIKIVYTNNNNRYSSIIFSNQILSHDIYLIFDHFYNQIQNVITVILMLICYTFIIRRYVLTSSQTFDPTFVKLVVIIVKHKLSPYYMVEYKWRQVGYKIMLLEDDLMSYKPTLIDFTALINRDKF